MLYDGDKLIIDSSSTEKSLTVPTKTNPAHRQIRFAACNNGAHTTVKCTLINPVSNRPYSIRAILDNGCNATYILLTAAKRMGLQFTSCTKYPITVFLHDNPIEVDSFQTIATLSNGKEFNLPVQLDTLPNLPQECTLFDYDQFKSTHPEFSHLSFVPQADYEPIEMVIGSDVFWHLLKPESKIQVDAESFLYNTEFGYALVGRVNGLDLRSASFALKPKQILDCLCNLDVVGISELPVSQLREEEFCARVILS